MSKTEIYEFITNKQSTFKFLNIIFIIFLFIHIVSIYVNNKGVKSKENSEKINNKSKKQFFGIFISFIIIIFAIFYLLFYKHFPIILSFVFIAWSIIYILKPIFFKNPKKVLLILLVF